MKRYGYYPTYWSGLYALARKVLETQEEDWMPEDEASDASVQKLAEQIDGAIEDSVHEWLTAQEAQRANRAVAAAEARAVR